MRTLTADLFATLDGFAAAEDAPAYFGYSGPELERWIHEVSAEPQILLMGRVTYEMLARISRPGADAVGRRMTELPKLVLSSTLAEPLAWSNSTLASDVDEIVALKRQPGDPLRTIGSLSLVRSLMQRGLVDRLRLMVFPLILGDTGREPIFAGFPDVGLELVESEILDARLVMLEYRPADGAPTR